MPAARAVFYGITLAVLVFAVRTFASGPPPLWIASLVLVAYLGVVTIAVTQLGLRVFVDAMVRGPEDARGVVLTFDDGPDPASTPRILDALDAAGAKATFFVIGHKVKKHPEIAKMIVERGHAIGLHSYAHDRLMSFKLARAWRNDLKRGLRAIEEATGRATRLFRPPIGHTNPQTSRVLGELGLRTIGWSISGRDGVRTTADDVVRRVTKGLNHGAIVLLHDAAENGDHEPASVEALPRILEVIREKNLEVVPLERWLV
jgi:peptidoglycan/xylan/chitin deacetylase (PgdA/CDA1 family)